MSDLIERALVFAYKAHEGQKRKYTGDPYITHPIAVAAIVAEYTDDEGVIAAALLHDVVEDTEYTSKDIGDIFGHNVCCWVNWVTDVATLEDGNRKQRKAIERERLATAYPCAKNIKLADLIHNTQSIVMYDKNFAKVYLAEKRLILEECMDGANVELLTRAMAVLEAAEDT